MLVMCCLNQECYNQVSRFFQVSHFSQDTNFLSLGFWALKGWEIPSFGDIHKYIRISVKLLNGYNMHWDTLVRPWVCVISLIHHTNSVVGRLLHLGHYSIYKFLVILMVLSIWSLSGLILKYLLSFLKMYSITSIFFKFIKIIKNLDYRFTTPSKCTMFKYSETRS